MQNGLDGAVELVVGGLGIGLAQVADDLGVQEGAEGLGGRRDQNGEEGGEQAGRVDDILATEERQAADDLFAKIGVEHGMVLGQELLEVVKVGGGDIRVEIGDVGDEVNEVVEFLVVFAGSGGRGRDEDLSLGVVCEPLVVELLSIGSGGGCQGVTKQKRLTTRAAIGGDNNNNENNSLGIPPDLVLQTDQVSVDLFEGGHLSLGHLGGWRRTVF